MVSFICGACGNTVKKNQVEKHYQTVCRNCNVLSCIDCGTDFPGDSYAKHTSCITEAEKYQGHLYQAKDKENKGDAKQKEWLKKIQSLDHKDPRIKSLLAKVSEYSNVPRKKKKFENFCKNSVGVYDQSTLDKLWDAFSAGNDADKKVETLPTEKKDEAPDSDDEGIENRKRKKNDNDIEEDETNSEKKKKKADSNEKFKWNKSIKQILNESKDQNLSLKKLKKKVIKAYKEFHINNESDKDELKSLFDKKLAQYSKVNVVDGIVVFA